MQVDLVTAHHMLGQILSAQLQLRLSHLLLPAQIAQVVQRIAQAAQLRFLSVHRRETRASFVGETCNELSGFFQRGGLLGNAGFGFLGFGCLSGQTVLIRRNVGTPRGDKVSQLGFARGHRLAMIHQTFVALSFRRDRETQFIQLLGRFLFLCSSNLAFLLGRALARLFFVEILPLRFEILFHLCDARVGALHLLLQGGPLRLQTGELFFRILNGAFRRKNLNPGFRLTLMRGLVVLARSFHSVIGGF